MASIPEPCSAVTKIYRQLEDGFIVRSMTIEETKIAQRWYSDLIYSTDDLAIARRLSTADTRYFLAGELNGEMIGCAIANPIADDIFHAGYFYVAQNHRNRGYLKCMFETLSESCLRNSKMISADSVCHMVEAYKRMGFVERFKTLCVKGIPVIPSNIRGRSIIANISAVDFEDILKYDDKCFIRPGSVFRKVLLEKLLKQPATTYIALDERGRIIGYGSRRITCDADCNVIGPLYADNYDVAHAIMASLCNDLRKNESVWVAVWEPNHEALELLKAFGLHVAKKLTLTRIHMNGHLNELNPRVYAVTSAEVCSF